VSWVPFRSSDWPTTVTILSRMASPSIEGVRWIPSVVLSSAVLVAVGHAIGSLLEADSRRGRTDRRTSSFLAWFGAELDRDDISGWYVRLSTGTIGGAFLVATWILLLFFLGHVGSSPFIYFQF